MDRPLEGRWGWGRQMNIGSGLPSHGRQSSPGSKLEECQARRRCVLLEASQEAAASSFFSSVVSVAQLGVTWQSARLSPSTHYSRGQ